MQLDKGINDILASGGATSEASRAYSSLGHNCVKKRDPQLRPYLSVKHGCDSLGAQ